jgi:DNA-binding PadR family transcriptional regulator
MPTIANRETEMLKGNAATLVLALLAEGERHGYQIRQELADRSHQAVQISFGTLYPLLESMERRKLVRSAWVKAGKVRERRRYAITSRGLSELNDRRDQWERFVTAMTRILSSTHRSSARS